jgi:hypothetical protein
MTPPHFCDYLPFEEDLVLYLNKLEFHLPKDNAYQVWLNLACWFWRRRFFKIFSAFLLFRYYLPLEKGDPLHLNKLESPPPKDGLCQVWLKLARWFWRRSRKCKSLQTDRRTTDNRWSEKLTWAFSSGELKSYQIIGLTFSLPKVHLVQQLLLLWRRTVFDLRIEQQFWAAHSQRILIGGKFCESRRATNPNPIPNTMNR